MFKMKWSSASFYLLLVLTRQTSESNILRNANIVFIVADDLGWDDVSFHGSDQVYTPNIDLLAYNGVAFSRYYSHSICTPSRSAMLSGRYAHTMGMQGYPLTNSEDRGIPEDIKLMPSYFKDLGYKTHLVGKWHVGLSREEFLPTSRGFDSHFGHRGGFIDYYEYVAEEEWPIGPQNGFDLHRNLTAAYDVQGYITDIYTEQAVSIIDQHDQSDPLFLMVTHASPHSSNYGTLLQAPPEEVRKMNYIENSERKYYAAMVTKLDDSVGKIYRALQEKHMLSNTIIVFVSDNGGMTTGQFQNYASNFPMRGTKMTPWEGGVRLVGLLWAPTIQNKVWDGYIHSVDWVPTLLGAVGGSEVNGINGINLWDDIVSKGTSKRKEIFEINDYDGYTSVTYGSFKYIFGDVNSQISTHLGSELRGFKSQPPSYPHLLLNSDVYSAMYANGYSINIDFSSTRDKLRVNCFIPHRHHAVNISQLCQPSFAQGCLFNIEDDPCEYFDLSAEYPDVVNTLSAKLQAEYRTIMKRPTFYRDERALPCLHNYTWDVFIH